MRNTCTSANAFQDTQTCIGMRKDAAALHFTANSHSVCEAGRRDTTTEPLKRQYAAGIFYALERRSCTWYAVTQSVGETLLNC